MEKLRFKTFRNCYRLKFKLFYFDEALYIYILNKFLLTEFLIELTDWSQNVRI